MSTDTTTAEMPATHLALTYTAPIGPTKWRLVGVARAAATCDHCGRKLVNTYRVADPEGNEMTLGKTHVKAVTGYNLGQAEAARLLRLAMECGQRAERWTAWVAANPNDAALLVADINAWTTWYGRKTGKTYTLVTIEWDGTLSGGGPADEVRGWIGQGREWAFPAYLRRRVVGEFDGWLS